MNPSADALVLRGPAVVDQWFQRARHALVLALGVLGCLVLAGVCEQSSANLRVPDAATLARHWQQGDVIVLVRHAERCDRSSAPCLGAADGITVRGSQMASRLGQEYRTLDLSHTDIYASPATRTAQTASQMFGSIAQDQAWAGDCAKDLLANLAHHKRAGHNLVLVTHSECMQRLQDSLTGLDVDTPDYGASLVVYTDELQGLQVAGQIDNDDWPPLAVR
ncbi:MAG: Lipopolysaccharide core heptose(II)-phosphate phosphatase [Stenotrophomonas maltophilia]|nr:MAG: Lipopolysaccharide core heptose(II)-phosphate phosphatase [Stenotrophomonas maltophilia]